VKGGIRWQDDVRTCPRSPRLPVILHPSRRPSPGSLGLATLSHTWERVGGRRIREWVAEFIGSAGAHAGLPSPTCGRGAGGEGPGWLPRLTRCPSDAAPVTLTPHERQVKVLRLSGSLRVRELKVRVMHIVLGMSGAGAITAAESGR
jgi:hypothetical protein